MRLSSLVAPMVDRHGAGRYFQLLKAQQRAQAVRIFRVAQPPEGQRFNLTNLLQAHIELLGNLAKAVLAVRADAEAHADDVFLVRSQSLEDARGFGADVVLEKSVRYRAYAMVLKQIAEHGFTIAANGEIERYRITGDHPQLLHLLRGDFHVAREHPVIAEAKRKLREAGALGALMSGSGPTVFGVAPDGETADAIAKQLESPEWKVFRVSAPA